MNRNEAVKAIISFLAKEDIALFTTGLISREAFAINDRQGNFYMLGSMGLLSAFGLGIALNEPTKKVVVIEGDGSALMSLGNFPLIGFQKPRNLFHIVLDNQAYETTGSQPTLTNLIDLTQIASASAYSLTMEAESLDDFVNKLPVFLGSGGPAFFLAKVKLSNKGESPKVDLPPEEMKKRLKRFLKREI